MDRPLNETDLRKLEASLAVIEEAGLKLSNALATLMRTHRSIEGILRPPEPESGKRWQ